MPLRVTLTLLPVRAVATSVVCTMAGCWSMVSSNTDDEALATPLALTDTAVTACLPVARAEDTCTLNWPAPSATAEPTATLSA